MFAEFFAPAEFKTIWVNENEICAWLPTGRDIRGRMPAREIKAHSRRRWRARRMCDGAISPVFALRAMTGSLRTRVARQPKLRRSEGWCRRRDLNPRPPAYEADALPLSYAG